MVGFINSIMLASVGFSLFHKYCIFFFPAAPQQVSQEKTKNKKQLHGFLCCGQPWLSFTGIRHALDSALRALITVKPAPFGLHLTLIVTYNFAFCHVKFTQFMETNPTH